MYLVARNSVANCHRSGFLQFFHRVGNSSAHSGYDYYLAVYSMPLALITNALCLYSYRYFEGGVSSVYLWDLETGGFAGVVLIKKAGDGSKKIKVHEKASFDSLGGSLIFYCNFCHFGFLMLHCLLL